MLPEFQELDVHTHIWIDNIHHSGTQSAVSQATQRLDRTASECNLTWKPKDSHFCAKSYDFIGISVNHSEHTVTPTRRMLDKIASVDLASPTAGELESLGGRLLHASGISGSFPGLFWFALKFFRRVTNALNRCRQRPTDKVSDRLLCRRSW